MVEWRKAVREVKKTLKNTLCAVDCAVGGVNVSGERFGSSKLVVCHAHRFVLTVRIFRTATG